MISGEIPYRSCDVSGKYPYLHNDTLMTLFFSHQFIYVGNIKYAEMGGMMGFAFSCLIHAFVAVSTGRF